MAATLGGYLADGEAPLFSDDGYDAWGGYTGPFIVACTLRPDGQVLGRYENRAKPQDDQ